MTPLELWGGVECTVNRVAGRYHDQMTSSGHDRRPDDIARFAELGFRALRYPVLWERLAPRDIGEIDWRWPDERLTMIRDAGMSPIVGLLHHGSGPAYTSLVDDHFPELLARYARAVAERYPWVRDWTPVNEPLTTARFSGLYGVWYPHGRSDAVFIRALINQLRGIVLAMREIRTVNGAARLVQTEDLGRTSGTLGMHRQVEFERHRRWLSWDLLCGRVDEEHPLWDRLRRDGASEGELAFFLDHPCEPDVIGINYYLTSDRWLDEDLRLYPSSSHGGDGSSSYVDGPGANQGNHWPRGAPACRVEPIPPAGRPDGSAPGLHPRRADSVARRGVECLRARAIAGSGRACAHRVGAARLPRLGFSGHALLRPV